MNDNRNLIESFNRSAEDYSADRLTPGILAKKYEALSRYKAETPEQKTDLANALFDTIEKGTKAIASPDGRLDANAINFVENIRPLFVALAAPESLPYVPLRAPQALADLAISLADRAGKVTVVQLEERKLHPTFINHYRTQTTELASMLMQYAGLFAKEIDGRKPAGTPHQKFSQ